MDKNVEEKLQSVRTSIQSDKNVEEKLQSVDKNVEEKLQSDKKKTTISG